jgi:alpha-galactosidase
LWDKQNVLAIRIFDTGGDGGLYGINSASAMADVMDPVGINTEADFLTALRTA